MNSNRLEDVFKCLANEGRLSLLMFIKVHGEVCVCEITQVLKMSQPVVSQGLKILRENGFLQSESRGKWHYYRINESLPDWMSSLLDELSTKDACGIKEKVFARVDCSC